MRVISGTARGTKLFSPEGEETRPTSDRIKETIFNIIQNDLYEINFLDLFSGSGAIGIEALSRGAKHSTFVEYSKNAYDLIKLNLTKTKLIDKSEIFNDDIFNFISKNKRKFDIIFLDPPYSKNLLKPTLEKIVENSILSADGFIIVEQASKEPILDITGLTNFKTKIYKTTNVIFYKWGNNN